MTDIRRALSKYKQQKDRGDRLHAWFSLRRWQKATKHTGIAGPLLLVKKALPEESWQPGQFSLT